MTLTFDPGPGVRRSAQSTVAGLFLEHARRRPEALALDDGRTRRSYGEMAERTARLAALLVGRGVGIGDRVAILSENRLEFLELYLAAARMGAIVACQNWRLAAPELRHCLELVEPVLTFVSPRYADALAAVPGAGESIVLGAAYEQGLADATPLTTIVELDPEHPFIILYTSGTTGLPKGAVISHRAEIARNMSLRAEFAIQPTDTFVAWSPLYHMGAAEFSLGTLMAGGKVMVVDGFDQAHLAQIIADEELGWLLLMPGMVGDFASYLEARKVTVKGMRVCGVMADLVPPVDIARITTLLGAPYANTFGATETGCPPCSSDLIPIGVVPESLSKSQSPFCEVRLVDSEDNEVADGQPGELCMRGPTNFSGYWQADETNSVEFRGGWFHMGDVFVRNPDGSLDFVDRVKYLIKSGGENIYPAEIERVILDDPRVADAAVVRRHDSKWGEVPVAFVARRDAGLQADDLYKSCRAGLAGYKQPKDIFFIDVDDFPRSASGKIQRHELEKRLGDQT
ncbi:MAG: acyl--CoA ligase [Rhodospirillales bacterium]|nr:acyl--CoA ligase [Rhodospirillales bacterium]